MKNTGLILGALILGAGIGAMAGILMAPAAGHETRKKLSDGAMDLANTLKDQVLDQLEQLKNPLTAEHMNQQEEYDHILGI